MNIVKLNDLNNIDSSYKTKYIKYKNKYLDLKNHVGGDYKNFKDSFKKKKEKKISICQMITNSNLRFFRQNEGRNNSGIGFLDSEELFFKFGYEGQLFASFKYGQLLSKLKDIYPYFIEVYDYIRCSTKNLGNIGEEIKGEGQHKNIDILITQKGGKTIYKWINDNIYKFIKKNIPNYEDIITDLDNIYINVFARNGITIKNGHNGINNYYYNNERFSVSNDFTSRDYKKMNPLLSNIKNEYENEIKPIIKELFMVSLKFHNEFLPLLKENLKIITYQMLMINMISLLYLNTINTDKKSDNFMVHTEKWDETKSNFIQINIKEEEFKFVNVANWGEGEDKEIIYLYPVDFPEITDEIYDLLSKNKPVSNYNLDKININLKVVIFNLIRFGFYSDVKNISTRDNIKDKCVNIGDKGSVGLSYVFNHIYMDNYNPFYFDNINSLNDNLDIITNVLNNDDFKLPNMNDLSDVFMYSLLIMFNKELPRSDEYGFINTIKINNDIIDINGPLLSINF